MWELILSLNTSSHYTVPEIHTKAQTTTSCAPVSRMKLSLRMFLTTLSEDYCTDKLVLKNFMLGHVDKTTKRMYGFPRTDQYEIAC